jgi:D-arabinose 1-dehydrogenase-like Zn-dependent alcohol dehydrogenase
MGMATGQVSAIGIGGLGHWQLLCGRIWLRSNCLYDRVRTRRRRLEALARPLCRSNSDAAEIHQLAGAFDLLLAMVKVPLDLPAFINALGSNGRTHFVGVKFVPITGE